MEIRGNTIHFSTAEKNKIKKLVDRKYGKISTPIDYETTGGDFDIGLEAEIFKITGEMISGSTLERLVGLRGTENRGVRRATLITVAKYLDFQNSEQFLQSLESSFLHREPKTEMLDLNLMVKNHLIKIAYGKDKGITIRHLSTNDFEVVHAVNSIILKSDRVKLLQLEIGEELICRQVVRMISKKTVILGKYRSGENNIVSAISLAK